MKRTFSAVMLASMALLAGCQTNTQTVTQITGPASAPTEAMVVTDVPAPAPVAAPVAITVPPVAPIAAPAQVAAVADSCGAAQYLALVGGPSSAVFGLPIPGSSRHYGSEERTATDSPSRLNFVHSGTAIDAVVDPASTIRRVFCG